MARAVPTQQIIHASAARTATPTATTYANGDGHRGVVVVIDVTAIAASPGITVTIQGYSPVGDDYYTILAGLEITGTGTTVMRVYPGLTASNNVTANDVLPPQWRVNVVHTDSDSITYSVNAMLIP